MVLVIWFIYNLGHPLTTPFTDMHSYMVQTGMYIYQAICVVSLLTQAVFFLYLVVLLVRSLRK